MKARIVDRTAPDGRKEYVIQQRHFLFRWQWVDAWLNSWAGAACRDSFPTLEEAQRNLCWFDGTPCAERVMPNAPAETRRDSGVVLQPVVRNSESEKGARQ